MCYVSPDTGPPQGHIAGLQPVLLPTIAADTVLGYAQQEGYYLLSVAAAVDQATSYTLQVALF
jgi:hypothetical protein